MYDRFFFINVGMIVQCLFETFVIRGKTIFFLLFFLDEVEFNQGLNRKKVSKKVNKKERGREKRKERRNG